MSEPKEGHGLLCAVGIAFGFGVFFGAWLLVSFQSDETRAAPSPAAVVFPKAVAALTGWRPEDTPGSNTRRVMGRLAYVLILATLADGFVQGNAPSWWLASPLLAYATVLFVVKVLYVLIVLSNRSFIPSTSRLLGDVVLSSFFIIVVFGYVFQLVGIQYTLDGSAAADLTDHYYFAAVTFSTLGYGDFAPQSTGHAREVAAFLAILGNIHLGLLAGSLMALIKTR